MLQSAPSGQGRRHQVERECSGSQEVGRRMPVVEGREPQALQVEHQKEVQVFLREKQELLMGGGDASSRR